MFFDRKEYMIPQIKRKAGFKFKRIAAPQPADIAKASGNRSTDGILAVGDNVVPLFRAAAKDLVKRNKLPVLDVLTKAIASICG